LRQFIRMLPSNKPKATMKQLDSLMLDRQSVKGTILFGGTEVPCTIGTLSKIGGCLLVQTTHDIPEVFEFIAPNRAPQACKVMWRDDKRLGIHFRQC
jgi:hypothetical protein